MKFYHYTYKERLESILEKGLVPSAGNGENLPFVMLDKNKYHPKNGVRIYLEVEIPENDTNIIHINDSWIEYHGAINPEQITGIARDFSNEDIIVFVKNGGNINEFENEFCQYEVYNVQ